MPSTDESVSTGTAIADPLRLSGVFTCCSRRLTWK